MIRLAGPLLLIAAAASAQSVRGQDSSLAGVRSVSLVVAAPRADSARVADDFTLELRKTGIRVVPLGTGRPDATIYVTFIARDCGERVQLAVEQPVRLIRNNTALNATTWSYFDDAGGGACGGAWIRAAMKRATDAFLTKWLDANGR